MALPDRLRDLARQRAGEVGRAGGTIGQAVAAAIECCGQDLTPQQIQAATLTARFAYQDSRRGRIFPAPAGPAPAPNIPQWRIDQRGMEPVRYQLHYSYVPPGETERRHTTYWMEAPALLDADQLRQAAYQHARDMSARGTARRSPDGPDRASDVTVDVLYQD